MCFLHIRRSKQRVPTDLSRNRQTRACRVPEYGLQGRGYQDPEGRVPLRDLGRDGARRELSVEALVSLGISWTGFGEQCVDFRDRGCVSGFQMQNLREYLKQGDPDGEYQWDFMDGLDEVPEEYQEKLKTAVIKGKIADEDWKGVSFHISC